MVHGMQRTYACFVSPYANDEDLKYLPSGVFLRGAALSFDEMLADLLWMRAIAYVGDHYQTDRQYPWLAQLIETTTSLDPYFQDPYEFGGVIFGYVLNDVERSNAIFAQGMTNVPKHHKRYWYLPFFTAFNYMYYQGDYATAARYLEQAASFPQRPDYLPLLVARLYANTEDPALAIPFLEKMMEQAATPEMQQQLQQRIGEIRVKEDLRQLNLALDQFRELKGREPKTLEELVVAGLLSRIPREPFGGHYFIDPKNQKAATNSTVDALEMQGDIKTRTKTKVPLPFQVPSPTTIPLQPTPSQ